MAEEQQKPAVEVKVQEQPAASSAATQNTEQQPQEQTVPYARFKEINDQLKAFKDDADKQAKARQAEEEQKLAQTAEWQKLAEKRGGDLEALKPRAELADKLTELVTVQYQADINDWPAEVKAMAPADDASILDKLAWMAKAKPLAMELMKDKTPIPGNGARPKPIGAAGAAKADEKQRETWTTQATRRYR
jgi:hypothetical protein